MLYTWELLWYAEQEAELSGKDIDMKKSVEVNVPVSTMHENGHMKGDTGTTDIRGIAGTLDGGALFVLESKGNWKHAGFHLATSISGPAILSLPFAVAGLGWSAGIIALVIVTAVSFTAYMLVSQVLEQAELEGHRFLRFRDLGGYVLGRRYGYYPVAAIQITVCFVTVIACIILGGQGMKFIYRIYTPTGGTQLYEFIIYFGLVVLLIAQLPSFHSLRYINLLSVLCCLGYSLCVVAGSIYAGHSGGAPAADYSVIGTPSSKFFGVFNALAIIITTYGNSIIPEIQATLAPPATGQMFKGLLLCYSVVISTFFSAAASGYWAFGNGAAGNIFTNLAPYIPKWLVFLGNMFVITQLVAISLVYSQPTFEIFEGLSSDVGKGMKSMRNLLPRAILRTLFVALSTLIAAAIPFFGDIAAFVGAVGFTPLDFVLPFILYSATFKPSPRTFKFWLYKIIMVLFSIVALLGCVSSIHQIVVDSKTYKLFADLG